MAQTGYTPISIYYSATATNTPTAGNLVAGELAINTADGKLFYKDSSGVVQTMASKATTAGTYSSITTSNLTIGTTQLGAGNSSIMKNRIINGAMVIDQRNAGASVATNGTNTYSLDRWRMTYSQNSKFTVQQNANSVATPIGFSNYLGVVSSSAYSVSSTDSFTVAQYIEGFNTSDLNWGTANAKTVTLSFQVYSSLTGTFGGSLMNSGFNRSYPFTYTISSANTWTTISVTVAGDTSGTWIGATNGIGLRVFFSLGAGSTYSGTAGAWATGEYYSATGATSVVGTSGATFYITGVQLEVGSSATGFEYVNYQTSLANCQRYYSKSYSQTVVAGTVLTGGTGGVTIGGNVNNIYMGAYAKHPITLRASPTIIIYDNGGNSGKISYYNAGWVNNGSFSTDSSNDSSLCIEARLSAGQAISFDYTASAEL